jgi:hypothetical protein
MAGPGELLAQLPGPTVLSALVLIVLVAIVIKIGRILMMAAIFGAIAGAPHSVRATPPRPRHFTPLWPSGPRP